ncbi:MAG: IS110 family transposase [Acidobacteria bacterium]|nr:IS110 family transposase [Acidobacteriota bacterium]
MSAERKDRSAMMVVGVDSHKDSLVCVVVDQAGRAAGSEVFANTAVGHEAMWAWVRQLGCVVRVGIEGSGSYGRGLAQMLVTAGHVVVDVPPQMTARARRRQRTRTKTDPGDALGIARVALREDGLPQVQAVGLTDDLRALCAYRRELSDQLVKASGRLHAELAKIRCGYRHELRTRITLKSSLDKVLTLLGEDHSIRADLARSRVSAMRTLINQTRALDTQIRHTLHQTGTTLTQIRGIAELGAAEILAQVGHPNKYPTKAKFAMANGTAPVQASSGRVVRHRLNRGGNRQLNRTIHTAAITQIRQPGTEGRLYYNRLLDRGKTKKEAIRCLKRRISDRIWTHLQHTTTQN